MKPLGKTEQALIDRAKGNGRSAVVHGYRTGRKRGSYGGREADALASLVKRGLVRVLRSEHYRDCRASYSDHWTETVYELVREATCPT